MDEPAYRTYVAKRMAGLAGPPRVRDPARADPSGPGARHQGHDGCRVLGGISARHRHMERSTGRRRGLRRADPLLELTPLAQLDGGTDVPVLPREGVDRLSAVRSQHEVDLAEVVRLVVD